MTHNAEDKFYLIEHNLTRCSDLRVWIDRKIREGANAASDGLLSHALDFWYVTLRSMVSGYRDLWVKDERIQKLLEHPNKGLLTDFRDAVCHFEMKLHDKRIARFREAGGMEQWALELYYSLIDYLGREMLRLEEEARKSSAPGMTLLRPGTYRVVFSVPMRTAPTIRILSQPPTGADFLVAQATEHGFLLHIIESSTGRPAGIRIPGVEYLADASL